MFRAILAHFQEALYKQQLVYYVRFVCVVTSNPGSSQQTQHARSVPIVGCAARPKDEQLVLKTCTDR
jgi:hypothetical protein